MSDKILQQHIVLLVEDDPDHKDFIKEGISKTDQLFHVSDGNEALDYLYKRGAYDQTLPEPIRQPCPRPEVILLDLKLGPVTGLMVLEEVKTGEKAKKLQLHLIPVIILTTSARPEDIRESLGYYANCYFQKPSGNEADDDILAEWETRMKEIDHYWFELKEKGVLLAAT